MGKKIYLLLFVVVFLIGCAKKTNNELIAEKITEEIEAGVSVTQELDIIKYVNASAGLRVRNSPDITADRIGSLPDLTEVRVLKEDGDWITIDGVNGKWTFIETDDIQGWVFGGYLSSNSTRSDLYVWARFSEWETYDEMLGSRWENTVQTYITISSESFTYYSISETIFPSDGQEGIFSVTNFTLQDLAREPVSIQEFIKPSMFRPGDPTIENYPVGYRITGTVSNLFRNRWPDNNSTMTIYVFAHKDDPSKLLWWQHNPSSHFSQFMDKITIDDNFIDEQSRVIESQKADEESRLKGDFSSDVGTVVFSPDSSQIVTTTPDGPIILWDLATGQEIKRFIGHAGPLRLVFSPNGRQILSSSDATIKLWDIETGHELWTFTIQSPLANARMVSLRFGSDGKQIFVGMSGSIIVLDASTGKEVRAISIPILTYSVAISPDGSRIVTGSGMPNLFNPVDTVHLWDMETGNLLRSFFTGSSATASFSPDGRFIIAYNVNADALRNVRHFQFFNTETYGEVRIFPNDDARFISFSPDGRYITSGETDGTIKLSDAETGSLVRTFSTTLQENSLRSLSFSPDGRHIVSGHLLDWDDGLIILWDAETGHEVRRYTGLTDPDSMLAAFSPDGRYIVTGYYSYRKTIWAVSSGEEIMTLGREPPHREWYPH